MVAVSFVFRLCEVILAEKFIVEMLPICQLIELSKDAKWGIQNF